MNELNPQNYFSDWSDETPSEDTPIKRFYKDKVVFLTGGLGFLGQLYVEKLLRCNVKRIYLLVRPKKGMKPEQRFEKTFRTIQFSKLCAQDPKFLERLTIIEGDMEKLKLGISETDEQTLIENVELVIHAASDVRFDEKLKKLCVTNVCGTRELLELSTKMKNIQAFTFISTAFSCSTRTFAEEKFYDPPVDPNVLMQFAKMDNDSFDLECELLTENIIQPWSNTYTFTKAVTEELVRRYGDKIPICIVRPSIVISTYEEPTPGWSNNIYGLNGIMVSSGMGVLRIQPFGKNNVSVVICADYVINCTLAALWETYESSQKSVQNDGLPKKDPEIYHICTSADVNLTWSYLAQSSINCVEQYPIKGAFWKCCVNVIPVGFWFKYFTILYHVFPAILSDIYFKLTGVKLRVLPVYRKAQRFLVAVSFFMGHPWHFDNTNTKRIIDKMTPDDRKHFSFDTRNFNWDDFTYDYVNGLKLYIGGETLDDVEEAQRKYKKLILLHYFVLVVFYGFHFFVLAFVVQKLGICRFVTDIIMYIYNSINIQLLTS